jgi:excisionase family DNA binding protein
MIGSVTAIPVAQAAPASAPPAALPAAIKPTLGLRDIAKRLDINYETARRWANLGRLPVFKYNGVGRWRATQDQVDEFLEKHKNTAATWSDNK